MNKLRLGLIAVTALLLGAPLASQAALTYDLRITGGGKTAIAVPGQVITLDLFAVVTGAPGNSAEEGFQNGFGSIVSSTGGNIQGNLSATLATAFAASGSQAGTVQDLDSDGDMDIGSNAPDSTNGFLFARAGTMQTTSGITITDGREFKIATLTFTVGTIVNTMDPTPIFLNFRVPSFTGVTMIEGLWQEDGLPVNANSGPLPGVGANVLITGVPEPSSALLLGLGALGWMTWRRRGCG